MGALLSTNRLTTVFLTVAVITALMRVDAVKEVVLNDRKFLGIF
jgi:DMSO/TMAO reductase YedYZ heme-binding membrane subunit